MQRSIVFIFIMLSKISSPGQSVTGTWEGNYEKTLLMMHPQKLVVEIFLYNDSLVTGATHVYYKNNKYEHYKITGKFNKQDSTIFFKEDSIISIKLAPMADNCPGSYKMKLNKTDSSLILLGKWKDISRSLFHCPTVNVWLEKKIVNGIKPIAHSDDVNLENLSRNSDIQSIIEINQNESDSIKIDLYDNGIVDHDSVSLYLNDSLLVYRKMITTNPISITTSLKKETQINKLKLCAESIGDIPPCTALMIVTTKKKRYEINLSSSFTSNAIVEFFIKE